MNQPESQIVSRWRGKKRTVVPSTRTTLSHRAIEHCILTLSLRAGIISKGFYLKPLRFYSYGIMGDLDSTLVIGGCRGLEFHLVIQLLQSGEAADATVPDIDIKRSRVEGARYVKDSVTSYEDVSSVLADVKPRAIFHLALPHAMYQSATPKLFDEVNVYGTENLLDCIYEHGGVKVLIYTPTTGVIHDGYTDSALPLQCLGDQDS